MKRQLVCLTAVLGLLSGCGIGTTGPTGPVPRPPACASRDPGPPTPSSTSSGPPASRPPPAGSTPRHPATGGRPAARRPRRRRTRPRSGHRSPHAQWRVERADRRRHRGPAPSDARRPDERRRPRPQPDRLHGGQRPGARRPATPDVDVRVYEKGSARPGPFAATRPAPSSRAGIGLRLTISRILTRSTGRRPPVPSRWPPVPLQVAARTPPGGRPYPSGGRPGR
ncbi:hypothetical protein NKH77_51605 [Streptomyces sp. M19]